MVVKRARPLPQPLEYRGDNMDNRDIVNSLGIISDILSIQNKEIEEIKKRVDKIESVKNDNDYTIIRIPINASNLDVLRKVFNCKITNIDDYELGIAHLDMDDDTLFNTRWLKSKYKGVVKNE